MPAQSGVPWSSAQIHDTVAVILREPRFASVRRESLAGRLLRFLAHEIDALFARVNGSPAARDIVLTLLAAAIVLLVARGALVRRSRDSVRRVRSGAGRRTDTLHDAWATARALADDGRHTDACHVVYEALVHDLARRGAITFHASKTGGDYWRELRARDAALAAAFRTFALEYDRLIYGTGVAAASDFEALMAAARPLAGAAFARAA